MKLDVEILSVCSRCVLSDVVYVMYCVLKLLCVCYYVWLFCVYKWYFCIYKYGEVRKILSGCFLGVFIFNVEFVLWYMSRGSYFWKKRKWCKNMLLRDWFYDVGIFCF